MEFHLKKTVNGTHRVLVDGNVHPLLCGITNYKEAVDRTKAVMGLDDVELKSHRFYVGEQYVFLSERFVQKEQAWTSLYRPWVDQFHGLDIVVLECVSSHAVPGEWDDKALYKGYKFKLVKTNMHHRLLKPGVEFHNQFPRAAYGQLSTDADYYATLHVTGEDDTKDWIDSKLGSGMMGYFEEAGIKIDAIHCGIRDIKARAEKEKIDLSKEVTALQEHLDKVLIPTIGEMGFQVQTKPYVSWYLDGRVEEHDDMLDTDVILK